MTGNLSEFFVKDINGGGKLQHPNKVTVMRKWYESCRSDQTLALVQEKPLSAAHKERFCSLQTVNLLSLTGTSGG